MNNNELTKHFHKRMKKQIVKEYMKNGIITPKMVLVGLDSMGSPVITYKKVNTILNFLNDDDFHTKNTVNKIVRRDFIKSFKDDGYEVVSYFHVDYDEDGEVFTNLKYGENLEKDMIHHYEIEHDTIVQEDGTLKMDNVVFRLVNKNW